jgi:stage V sporulation protein B
MKKNNLISGAIMLSVGAVLAKIFSAIYRIALTRILGGEGIGLYQLVFPFYSLCVVLATAGLPLAISKVVAKNKGNEISILKKSFLLTSVVALILTFIFLISSKGIAVLQGQKDLTICYIILSPSIILVSAVSVIRGYFQGKHNFVPSAISNIAEQLIKLGVGLILSLSLISVSILASIVGAMIGIVISEVISLFVLILFIKKEKFANESKFKLTVRDLTKDIFPITLTNIILPISTFIDSVLVVNLLNVNFSNEISVFLYGLESGAVSSLVGIPTIFSFAIASVLLPNITREQEIVSKNKNISFALKIILIIAIPCVLCFMFFPDRILNVLYQGKLKGFNLDGTKIASMLLVISSVGIVFFAINQLYSICLQAVEQRFVTIRNLLIAVGLKFVVQILFLAVNIQYVKMVIFMIRTYLNLKHILMKIKYINLNLLTSIQKKNLE